MDEVHWYIIEAQGVQSGPYFIKNLKDLLRQNLITPDTFCWHEETDGWDRISNVFFRGRPALQVISEMEAEAVTVVSKPEVVQLEVAPPSVSRLSKNFMYEELKDKPSICESNLIRGWSAEETQEGLAYYHNTLTGDLRFSAPESNCQIFFDQECVWVPDLNDVYSPATVIQRIGLNEHLKIQRQDSANIIELTGKTVQGVFPLDRESYHTLKHVSPT